MAASQPIKNQQRSYKVFEKKHYMECTTRFRPQHWPLTTDRCFLYAWCGMKYPRVSYTDLDDLICKKSEEEVRSEAEGGEHS